MTVAEGVTRAITEFQKALDQDMYPAEYLEGIFGVKMDPEYGRKIAVQSPFGENEMKAVGQVVYNCWVTLRRYNLIREKEIAIAIFTGSCV